MGQGKNKKTLQIHKAASFVALFAMIQSAALPSFAQTLMCQHIYSLPTSTGTGTSAASASTANAPAKQVAPDFLSSGELYGVYLTEADTNIETLLKLAGNTLFIGANRKETLEKGELRLAMPIGNGYSLEGEYQGDKRSGQNGFDSYKLIRLHLILPNSLEVNLDKNPLTVDSQHFQNKSYLWRGKLQETSTGEKAVSEVTPVLLADINTWAGAKSTEQTPIDTKPLKKIGKDPIAFLQNNMLAMSDVEKSNMTQAIDQRVFQAALPRVITGQNLEQFKRWVERMEYLTHQELRDHNTDRAKLWGKYFSRKTKDGFINKSTKQIYGWLFIGALAYLYTNWKHLKDMVLPLEDRIDILSGSSATSAEATIFYQFLYSIKADQNELQQMWRLLSKKTNDKKSFPLDQTEDQINLISTLFKLELEKGKSQAHVEVYESNSTDGDYEDFVLKTSDQPVNIARHQLKIPANIVVTDFQSAQIITITLVSVKNGMDRVKTLVVKKSRFPKLYNSLREISNTLAP